MGYSLNWHVERRALNLKLFDSVSAEELMDCNLRTLRYIEEGVQPVHIIIDTLAVTTYPPNLRWVMHMIQGNPSKALGWRIVVANDDNIRVLLSTILSVLHVPIHTCVTVQQAHDFLKELDPSPTALAR